ncbi:hypothetical protein [Kitasatospora sp. NPDC059571]|uniref:hypothetical protein n=1 Tax=Kitasatospora sp. NPDC059571 TaxID=3346871 RepID=UPI0036A5FD65
MGDSPYDIPGDNPDYGTWDFRQILHVFTGQAQAYESAAGLAAGQSSVPDPRTLFQAATAIGDTGAAMAVTHHSINQLISQVNRGDWWAGPTADGFSQMLSQANSVLMDHADALYTHQNSFHNAGSVLSQVQENVLTMWDRACAALAQWWYSLNPIQQRNYEFGKSPYLTREHFPPVEVKDGTTYYRVGDFPTIAEPLTQAMRDQLNQLATVYRTEIANTQTLEDVNLTGGGLGGTGGPNLGNIPTLPNLQSLPDTNDLLKGLGGSGGPGSADAGGAVPPPPGLGGLGSGGGPAFDGGAGLGGSGGPGSADAGGAVPPPPGLGGLGSGGGPAFDGGAGLGGSGGPGSADAGGAVPPPPGLSGLASAGGAIGGSGPVGTGRALGGSSATPSGAGEPGMPLMPMFGPTSLPAGSSGAAATRSASLPAGSNLDLAERGQDGLPTGRIGAPSVLPKPSTVRPPTFSALEDTAVPGPSSFAKSAKTDPLQQEFADLLGKDPKVAALTAAARQEAGAGALGEPGQPSSPKFSGGPGPLGARTAAAEMGAETLAARTAAAETGAVGAAGRLAGAAGPAGPAGGGMPYMPPMGGMGQGQRPGGAGERERTTWLLEDEDVWGATERDAADGVIGRPTQR